MVPDDTIQIELDRSGLDFWHSYHLGISYFVFLPSAGSQYEEIVLLPGYVSAALFAGYTVTRVRSPNYNFFRL